MYASLRVCLNNFHLTSRLLAMHPRHCCLLLLCSPNRSSKHIQAKYTHHTIHKHNHQQRLRPHRKRHRPRNNPPNRILLDPRCRRPELPQIPPNETHLPPRHRNPRILPHGRPIRHRRRPTSRAPYSRHVPLRKRDSEHRERSDETGGRV